MRNYITALFLIIPILILSGCSTRDVIVTQKVEIPVRCQIEFPIKRDYGSFRGNRTNDDGTPTNEYLQFIKRKLENNKQYILELEYSLRFCITGDSNVN